MLAWRARGRLGLFRSRSGKEFCELLAWRARGLPGLFRSRSGKELSEYFLLGGPGVCRAPSGAVLVRGFVLNNCLLGFAGVDRSTSGAVLVRKFVTILLPLVGALNRLIACLAS